MAAAGPQLPGGGRGRGGVRAGGLPRPRAAAVRGLPGGGLLRAGAPAGGLAPAQAALRPLPHRHGARGGEAPGGHAGHRWVQPALSADCVASPRSPGRGDPAGGPHHGRAAPVHGPRLPRLPRPRQPGRLPLLALRLASVRAAVRDTPPAPGGVRGVRRGGRQADTAQARAPNGGSGRFHNYGEGP